jgi:hypothetical protein
MYCTITTLCSHHVTRYTLSSLVYMFIIFFWGLQTKKNPKISSYLPQFGQKWTKKFAKNSNSCSFVVVTRYILASKFILTPALRVTWTWGRNSTVLWSCNICCTYDGCGALSMVRSAPWLGIWISTVPRRGKIKCIAGSVGRFIHLLYQGLAQL